MKRYSVTMFYTREVEVIAENEQDARKKARSEMILYNFGSHLLDKEFDVELKGQYSNIDKLRRMNKENNKNYPLEKLQRIEKYLSDDNCTAYNMYNNLSDIFNEEKNIYTHAELLKVMYNHATNGDSFLQLANDLDGNDKNNIYLFNKNYWDDGCKRIDTKEELINALFTGNV